MVAIFKREYLNETENNNNNGSDRLNNSQISNRNPVDCISNDSGNRLNNSQISNRNPVDCISNKSRDSLNNSKHKSYISKNDESFNIELFTFSYNQKDLMNKNICIDSLNKSQFLRNNLL